MIHGIRMRRTEADSTPAPAIIKDTDLKGFDDILKSDQPRSDWLNSDPVIDYHQKLNFSDDEDQAPARDVKKGLEGGDRQTTGREASEPRVRFI